MEKKGNWKQEHISTPNYIPTHKEPHHTTSSDNPMCIVPLSSSLGLFGGSRRYLKAQTFHQNEFQKANMISKQENNKYWKCAIVSGMMRWQQAYDAYLRGSKKCECCRLALRTRSKHLANMYQPTCKRVKKGAKALKWNKNIKFVKLNSTQ